jgi:NADPH:quinone reductase-like Zn-dependent oxidoreductase
MKAVFLTKYGNAKDVFEIRESPVPEPKDTEVLVKVETFGLNFADVIARRGMYGEAPENPCILGYEVVGHVEKTGNKVRKIKKGQKVVALTRFGGYAEYALSDEMACVEIDENFDNATATCLATQYATAYYAAHLLGNLQENDKILIHAAAGGVGIALTQLAKLRKCQVFGTVSSKEKMDFIMENGVDFPINYLTHSFESEVKNTLESSGLDVVFDPIGGKNFKKSKSLLSKGGRIITYGASDQLNGKKGFFNNMRLLFGFGFLHPVFLIVNSQSVLGVNLLRVADSRPDLIQKSMQEVVSMAKNKLVKPYVGGRYSVDQIAQAHELLENRKSIGKIAVNW